MKNQKFLLGFFFAMSIFLFSCEQEDVNSAPAIVDVANDIEPLDPVDPEPCPIGVGCLPSLVSCDIALTTANPVYQFWQNEADALCRTFVVAIECCQYDCYPMHYDFVTIRPTDWSCLTVSTSTPYYIRTAGDKLTVAFYEEPSEDIDHLSVQFSEYTEGEMEVALELSTTATINEKGERVFIFKSFNEGLSSEKDYVVDVIF